MPDPLLHNSRFITVLFRSLESRNRFYPSSLINLRNGFFEMPKAGMKFVLRPRRLFALTKWSPDLTNSPPSLSQWSLSSHRHVCSSKLRISYLSSFKTPFCRIVVTQNAFAFYCAFIMQDKWAWIMLDHKLRQEAWRHRAAVLLRTSVSSSRSHGEPFKKEGIFRILHQHRRMYAIEPYRRNLFSIFPIPFEKSVQQGASSPRDAIGLIIPCHFVCTVWVVLSTSWFQLMLCLNDLISWSPIIP